MFESCVIAFIIYFVEIGPVSNALIFLTVRKALEGSRKLCTALKGSTIATAILQFFALYRDWKLTYLNISKATFKIADCIILYLMALDILAAKRPIDHVR